MTTTLISEFKLSEVLSIGTPAVRARAEKEIWLHVKKTTQGGSKRLYVKELLPDDVKARLFDSMDNGD